MAARTAGRKGRPFVRAQQQCFAEETTCCFCGRYVDQTLVNYRSSAARSVHHLIPPDVAPELANDRDNMRLAHLGCNASYGRGEFRGEPTPGAPAGGLRRYGRTHRAHPRVLPDVVGAGTAVVSDRDW